jgi:hypothetical protein
MRGNFYFKDFKNTLYAVFCLFTLGRHGNFTAGVTSEQPDLLRTALALNIELLSINMCTVLETSY